MNLESAIGIIPQIVLFLSYVAGGFLMLSVMIDVMDLKKIPIDFEQTLKIVMISAFWPICLPVVTLILMMEF